MSDQKIELLTDEALRLVDASLDINCLIKNSIPLPDDSAFKKELEKNVTILENERNKLANNEMVIAVVGTMKAGKSTTINAIAGTEVLPYRNRPMTALPTLIRHTKGLIKPVLRPQNQEPITNLCIELAKKFKSGFEPIGDVAGYKEIQILIAKIKNGTSFNQDIYEGEEAIFEYLSLLNDLVRLSGAMGLRFPFEEYGNVDQVPLIEVEFTHLAGLEESKGQISVLDTPGPNEGGQPHLASMLKEQLSKASAVISVVDYTQIGSEADEEVRELVIKLPTELPLYVFINKIDDKKRNGDSPEEIKRLIVDQLMQGSVNEDAVFPISANQAYLSNIAKRHINAYGRLPDYNVTPWVKDFGEEAFGRRWESSIDDVHKVSQLVSEIWEDSKFSSPIKNVLHSAHTNSAKFSIKSAVEKTKTLSQTFKRELEFMSQGACKELGVLEQSVTALQADIEKLDEAEQAIKIQVNNTIVEVIKATKNSAVQIQSRIDTQVTKYFKEGKQQELNQQRPGYGKNKSKKYQEKKAGLPALFSNAISTLLTWEPQVAETGQQDFKPNETVIELSDRHSAKTLLKKIEASTNAILKDGQKQLENIFYHCFVELESELNEAIKVSIKPIQASIESELKEAGFAVSLNLPSFSKRSLSLDVQTMFDSALEEKSRSETRHRRQSGAWGKVCSWFNTDDWGWESYEVSVEYYQINLIKIRKKTRAQVTSFMKAIDQTIKKSIQEPVDHEVNVFFDDFGTILGSVVSNIQVSIHNQSLSTQEKARLIEQLHVYLERNELISDQVRELDLEVNDGTTYANK
ncbi:dynamin family protein [Vibrio cyclitrophicus]|uniref:dynamin family protein n=1 Tax=Vibrio cyclitrophicus TaxID=47951 RepID=UPI000C84B1F4|nr:dynamin family protein [Vibrio cyclitrophicus]PME92959.1 hypothetical protein BCV26_13110 [Vibrio cyclitrophicus]